MNRFSEIKLLKEIKKNNYARISEIAKAIEQNKSIVICGDDGFDYDEIVHKTAGSGQPRADHIPVHGKHDPGQKLYALFCPRVQTALPQRLYRWFDYRGTGGICKAGGMKENGLRLVITACNLAGK